MSRLALQTSARAGSVALVEGYRTASSVKLGQLYRARPTQIKTPSVFIDTVAESADDFTDEGIAAHRPGRHPGRVGHLRRGPDRGSAGMRSWTASTPTSWTTASTPSARTRPCRGYRSADDENWVPAWLPTDTRSIQPMFSTLIVLEGFAST